MMMELLAALDSLPPRPWTVWTSNSYRRIHSPEREILGGTNQSDGHPDLTMREDELSALCAVVNMANDLGARVIAAESAIYDHNQDCVTICQGSRDSGHCACYTDRGRICPDCPRHHTIDDAVTGEALFVDPDPLFS